MNEPPRLTIAAALVNELSADPAELERLRALLNTASSDRRVDVNEAADILHCTPGWLARAAKAGRVPGAVKEGNKWLFYVANLHVMPLNPVSDISQEGAGRGRRTPGDSATVSAIKNAAARRQNAA